MIAQVRELTQGEHATITQVARRGAAKRDCGRAMIRNTFVLLAFTQTVACGCEMDVLLRLYAEKLPQPATLSEGNGACLVCAKHGWVPYTLLEGAGSRLPLDDDEDLLQAIPWLKHGDPCIRQIAAFAITQRIGFGTQRLSLTGMNDPEHFYNYQIVLALKAYLDQRNIKYDPTVFERMLVDVSAKPLSSYLTGKWEEPSERRKNILKSVEIADDVIHVSNKFRSKPSLDHTNVSKIKEVNTNDQRQYVVSCEWDEQWALGCVPRRHVPSQVSYVVWPITNDVMWLKEASGGWKKFKRIKPQHLAPSAELLSAQATLTF
jgi:hypothetical protein